MSNKKKAMKTKSDEDKKLKTLAYIAGNLTNHSSINQHYKRFNKLRFKGWGEKSPNPKIPFSYSLST